MYVHFIVLTQRLEKGTVVGFPPCLSFSPPWRYLLLSWGNRLNIYEHAANGSAGLALFLLGQEIEADSCVGFPAGWHTGSIEWMVQRLQNLYDVPFLFHARSPLRLKREDDQSESPSETRDFTKLQKTALDSLPN